MSTARSITPDWLAKTLAGTLLGFTLAVGCSGVFSWLNSAMALPIRGQLAMWMIAPIWMGILSGVFFFRSGKHAWAWLTGANLLTFSFLAASRLL